MKKIVIIGANDFQPPLIRKAKDMGYQTPVSYTHLDVYKRQVKAVPKASVSTSERSIKKINGEPIREERRSEEKKAVSFTEPTQAVSDKPKKRRTAPAPTPRKAKPVSKEDDMDEIDFEKKLEESLKDL